MDPETRKGGDLEPVCEDNPYEQKLYSMFCGHDKDQLGWLTINALQQLCKTLELKENGTKLIDAVTERCGGGGGDIRVTFKAFKEELLLVLGTEVCESSTTMAPSPTTTTSGEKETLGSLVVKQEDHPEKVERIGSVVVGVDGDGVGIGGKAVSSHRSRSTKTMSPTREVAPKLVMGAKKYGRRSRPQATDRISSQSSGGEEQQLDSEDDEDDVISDSDAEEPQIESQGTNKVKRSASQADVKRRRQPPTVSKLKRCASLPARKNMAREFIRVRGSSPNKYDKAQLDSSVESLGNLDVENLSQTLYEIWIRICSELHANSNELRGIAELEQVFMQAGISQRVAGPLSEEIFEKLGLEANESTINFQQFIGLIQTEDNVMYFANNCANATVMWMGSVNDGDSVAHKKAVTNGNSTTNRINSALDSGVVAEEVEQDASGYASASSVDYQIVPSEVIVDMWEAVGIPNAAQLLKYDLGFEADQINIQQLSTAIDEELNGLRTDCPQDEQISKRLLRAALALNKAELNGLQVVLKHLGEENQKLHATNRDANDRVAMMAQEVDERHATIEKSTQLEIRTLEQKHSDSVRELAKQLEQDREQWAGVNAALEARIKHFETEELKLRTENGRLEERKATLEAEQVQHQKQLAELLETNIRLNTEICELEELQNKAEVNRTDRENEEIMELIEKITRLQMENTDLRDRNDELCAELDGLAGELSIIKGRKSVGGESFKINSNTTGNSDVNSEESEDSAGEMSLGSAGGLAGNNSAVATKRRGDSPSKSKIAEESPRLGKVRRCSTETNSCDSGGGRGDQLSPDWAVPLNAELESHTSHIKERVEDGNVIVGDLKARVVELEMLLKEHQGGEQKMHVKGDEKCLNCQEMESTLDLMRKEFDNLEDYWQGKLNEERLLFEEEQKVNDDKFNDLLQKMLDYEEQFASSMKKEEEENCRKRLSPIQERDCLEQQYLDLEQELEELRVQHLRMVKEKNEEIKSLRADVKNMQLPSIVAADPFNISIDQTSPPESPASSPINYLWSQSTIQAPARDYQNPNWAKKEEQSHINLTTLPTTSWATDDVLEAPIVVAPIQKPKPGSLCKDSNVENCDKVSVASSNDRNSTATYNVGPARDQATNLVGDSEYQARDVIEAVDAEELSQQQLLMRQLQADCKELSHKRDALLHELQQLSDVRPALEKNFAKTVHPSLTSRIQQLELRNRQLQMILKQQQNYSESIMHQSWQQQRMELGELRTRLESQTVAVADQMQRLAKADILVKELFVENSHLRANVQRLEQQTMRSNYMFQQHPGAPQGMNGVPSFP